RSALRPRINKKEVIHFFLPHWGRISRSARNQPNTHESLLNRNDLNRRQFLTVTSNFSHSAFCFKSCNTNFFSTLLGENFGGHFCSLYQRSSNLWSTINHE